MEYTLDKLCQSLGLAYSGNGEIKLNHVCAIDDLKSGGLAFITNSAALRDLPTPSGIFMTKQRDLDRVESIDDAAIIVPENVKNDAYNLIFSNDPLFHHIQATNLLHVGPTPTGGVHETAVIGNDVVLGDNVTIDANVVIYDHVKIGDHTVVRAGSVIMSDSSIGEHTLIYPNVTIRENSRIGNHVTIHAGTVIGSDGFGFFQRSGKNIKIPQVGGVIIEDDVEIGSCVTIDRARFTDTVIGKGCKLDNLVHIAHNVELGEHSLIAAQSGIAGSTKTGGHLMMGGQSGIRDNLVIGSKVTLLARTLLASKTGDKATVAGTPSRPIHEWRNVQALINNLEGLFDRVKALEKELKATRKKGGSSED